jgi:hypothetical protein
MLYAVGGNDGAADLAIIEVLDPAVGKWVPGPPLRGKSALWLACSHFVNDGGSSLKGNAPLK